jgi:hypothetical protein
MPALSATPTGSEAERTGISSDMTEDYIQFVGRIRRVNAEQAPGQLKQLQDRELGELSSSAIGILAATTKATTRIRITSRGDPAALTSAESNA